MRRRDEDVSRVLSALKSGREYLSSLTVAKYLDDRVKGPRVTQTLAKRAPVVFVDPGDTLGSILDTLASHRITSAPVIDRANGAFSGFVDVHEILAIFVRACQEVVGPRKRYGSELDRPPVTTSTSETVGINPGRLRNEGYGDMKEADLVSNLQSTLGAGLFSQTLRAARAENPVHERGRRRGHLPRVQERFPPRPDQRRVLSPADEAPALADAPARVQPQGGRVRLGPRV